MADKNISVFCIGIGPSLNRESVQKISTGSGQEGTMFLNSFDELMDEEKQAQIFEDFCSFLDQDDGSVGMIATRIYTF